MADDFGCVYELDDCDGYDGRVEGVCERGNVEDDWI